MKGSLLELLRLKIREPKTTASDAVIDDCKIPPWNIFTRWACAAGETGSGQVEQVTRYSDLIRCL